MDKRSISYAWLFGSIIACADPTVTDVGHSPDDAATTEPSGHDILQPSDADVWSDLVDIPDDRSVTGRDTTTTVPDEQNGQESDTPQHIDDVVAPDITLDCPSDGEWPVWPAVTPALKLLSEQYCETVGECAPEAADLCLPMLLSLAPLGDPTVFAAWMDCQLRTMTCPGTLLDVSCLLTSATDPIDATKLAVCDHLAASMDACLFSPGDKNLAYVQCVQIALSPLPMCAPEMCVTIDVGAQTPLPPNPPPPSALCAKFELCLTHTLNLSTNPAWGSGR